MKYFIRTFGCQQNVADSERIANLLQNRGMKEALTSEDANYIVINTCMIRQSAENRVYGLVNNLKKWKSPSGRKIVVTGCMVGLAFADKSGVFLKKLHKAMPGVDEFIPLEEIGTDYIQLRKDAKHAFVIISNGCNNFCSYCVVPYSRGKERSRLYVEIIKECKSLKNKDYTSITLLGQNVNSYGSDLIVAGVANEKVPREADLRPIYVKHLGRLRIPTLFPYLLDEVAKMGFEKVDFMSSNPWDFSDELIEVIARNKNITRTIHLPIQSGDDNVLKRMNRYYTSREYLKLVNKLRLKIKNLKLTTDIIVGFCGETEEEFQNTVKLCQKVGFEKAYISIYSPRPMTTASKTMKNDVPHEVKKKRWNIVEKLINRK
jgi:tRNA-2-methylthio-N6-dimethylallyladenosine synthase